MLKIDCLLLNTEVANTVRQIVGYLGHQWLAEGKDVSFKNMFNYLRDNGVEVDHETAAKIYADELPLNDARFTSQQDLHQITGAWFDKIVRAITLQKPKRGEQEIGELSPAQSAAKAIANVFSSAVVEDQRTKSVLKTLEDVYKKASKRLLGEAPGGKTTDTRTVEEILNEALDNEALGYRNLKDGNINGIAKLHDEVRSLLREMTMEMEEAGDHDKIEQWGNYVKSLEDASYSLMLYSGETKKVVNEALMDNGYARATKSGKEVVDWQRLAGNVNSYEQLRQNVISSLTGKGFSEDVAGRVADTLSKEFKEIRGRIMQINDQRQQRLEDSWTKANDTVRETLPELAEKRVAEWQNYTQIEGREDKPLKFSKIEAKKIIGNALKNSEEYGMEWGVDKRAIDWIAMAGRKPDAETIKALVSEQLILEGVKEETASLAAESVANDYADQLISDIDENSDRILGTKEQNIDRIKANRKTELERLAELHDLGIFENAHNKLLAKVLGIQEGDVEAMDSIRTYAEQMSRLRYLMSGNEFLAPTMQREIARNIQNLVANNIENKTRMLKIASALNKIYQVENSSLVSGYRNLVENHLSGLIEYATTKSNLSLKLGKKLAGNKKGLRELMADTWQVIAKGGTEFGLAPYQVGGNQARVTDSYNLNKMRGADWRNPKTWVKGTASAVLTVPRAFLMGTDGMFKSALYRLHFLSGMYDALKNTGNYSHEEAVDFLNESIYGEGQIEKAREKARRLYEETGMKYTSRKHLNLTANELLLENLLQGYDVTPDMIKEVQESAFKMAGLGMGHESNQPISKLIQSSKLHFQRTEQEALNDGRYSKAAGQRMWNTIINSVALRFAASQANWAWIKLEQSGIGLLSGVYHYQMGNRIKGKDLLNPDLLQEKTEQYQKGRQSMARGILGIAANALMTGVAIPAIANAMYEDEEDPVQAMFEAMKDNYLAKAIFLKTTPVWGLADYFYHTKNSDRRALTSASDVIQNVTGIGAPHSNAKVFAEASVKWASKREDMQRKGDAQMGQLFANNLPHVPFYKQGKDVLQTVDYFRTGENPMYHYPENFWQGLLGGGVMEDMSEVIPENSRPEWMEGWQKEK